MQVHLECLPIEVGSAASRSSDVDDDTPALVGTVRSYGCVRGPPLNIVDRQLAGAGTSAFNHVGLDARSADGGSRAECISSTEIEKMLLLESMVSPETGTSFRYV